MAEASRHRSFQVTGVFCNNAIESARADKACEGTEQMTGLA